MLPSVNSVVLRTNDVMLRINDVALRANLCYNVYRGDVCLSNISLVDSNFKIESHIKETDIQFYDVNQPPFKIYGVFHDSGKFRRLPANVAKAVSGGVYALHANTAGGRVRFKTDSPYVAIHSKMHGIGKMPHFALTGSAGFDLYVLEDVQNEATILHPNTKVLEFQGLFAFLGVKNNPLSTLHLFLNLRDLNPRHFIMKSTEPTFYCFLIFL